VYYNNFRLDASYMGKALESFARAREVDPQASSSLYSYVRTCVDLCRWEGWDDLFAQVAAAISRDVARGTLLSTSISLVYLLVYPVPDEVLLSAYAAKAAEVSLTVAGVRSILPRHVLTYPTHLAQEQQAAGRSQTYTQAQTMIGCAGGAASNRLTIGYVSADYREHPVSLLFQNVPSMHDRCRFRVVCFSLHAPGGLQGRVRLPRNRNDTAKQAQGQASAEHAREGREGPHRSGRPGAGEGDEGSSLRRIISRGADKFVELADMDLSASAAAIAAEGVHVLVDMNGYTQHSRPELFSMFLAEGVLSVSFLGFSASLMGPPQHAIAADRISAPPELRAMYTERMLYFPDTFYLADHTNSFHTRGYGTASAAEDESF
jgi:predicted O-linked N-acetylglucosamine transferase (SPINDLY family)